MANKNFLLISITFILALFAFDSGRELIPVTGIGGHDIPEKLLPTTTDPLMSKLEEEIDEYLDGFEQPLIALSTFTKNLTGKAGVDPAGIYSEDLFAFEIVQQPYGSINYVPSKDGVVSQFSTAKEFGSVGLLGHNYLAGAKFFELALGNEIQLIYGEGIVKDFKVIEIREFQAFSPTSTYSSFRDLATGEKYTSTELFDLIYNRPDHIILQVCITKGSNYNWGRYFIIAEPIE